MFNWLRNEDWRKSPAHLLLLSKFCNGDSPETYRKADYWESVLKEKPIQVIEKFLKEGVLETASLHELADYKFKASELKSLLREKALKVSGSKDELIQRLIENDEPLMRDATKGLVLYRCTKEGMQLAEHYVESEKAKKNAAEKATFDLLSKKDILGAVRIVAQYESSQVFSRGLGVDWKNYDIEAGVKYLRYIFEGTPEILKGIEKEQLEVLRLAAAMMNIWGTNTAKSWLPEGFETGIHLDGDVASRMLVFYSSHIENMRGYRLASAKAVEVVGVDDENACSECKKISGKKYKLEKVPELPYAKCTCVRGCRCIAIADLY